MENKTELNEIIERALNVLRHKLTGDEIALIEYLIRLAYEIGGRDELAKEIKKLQK